MVGPFGGRLFENFRPDVQSISASPRRGFCIFGTTPSRFLAKLTRGKGAPAESLRTYRLGGCPVLPGKKRKLHICLKALQGNGFRPVKR